MENFVTLAITAVIAVIVIRILLKPMKWALKLAIHAACGFICLWLLNSVSGFTGLEPPINAMTVLLSGTLGVPGIVLVILLELF